jgi:hypothetical protein
VEDGNGEALLTAGLREVRHGVGVGGEKRCSGAAGGTSRRWQCHPRDRLGLGRWVTVVAVNLTLSP